MSSTSFNASANRQLAAILFADIADYTSLMQKDETLASTLLNRFQNELTEKVSNYNGRIVNFYGDGALCTFRNPLEAIRCAIEVQSSFQSEPKVPVRIGMHMGTVISEGEKVYGDSINLASRIESMGIPGAILVSKKVRDEVKNQPDLFMPSLGKFEFKNVEEPMEVFALANEGFAVPNRKSIKGKFQNKGISSWLKWTIPITGLLTIAIVMLLFIFNNRAKAGTETVLITTEDGEISTRIIPKVGSTKRLVIFPFENKTGDRDLDWLEVGGSYLLDKDLEQDVRLYCIQALSLKYHYESYSQIFLDEIPFATQVKITQDLYTDYFIVASIQQDTAGLRLHVKSYATENGQEFYTKEFTGTDIFEMLDQLATDLSNHLYPVETGLAFGEIDLPVSNLVSQNKQTLRSFFEGLTMQV